MVSDIIRTQHIGMATYAPRSTNLTQYEICELLDDVKGGTGVFKLARKTLEEGLPFLSYCNHSHNSAAEADACAFFASHSNDNADAEIAKARSTCQKL